MEQNDDRFTKDTYTFVKASFDGGVTLECWRNEALGVAEEVMTAVWRDDPQEFVVKAASAEIPFEIWESFIAEARRWCPNPGGRYPL
jgi:hypothetical protein